MSSVLAKRRLIAHPDYGCPVIDAMGVKAALIGDHLLSLEYAVIGRIAELRIPPLVAPGRADGLWQQTCFEAFVKASDDAAYLEFNFSPSTRWAAYRFDGYRQAMQDAVVSAPPIEVSADADRLALSVTLDLTTLIGSGPISIGLSAVIEEAGGRKSYWALAHAPGKPDFHHSDCFVLELPAAIRP